MPPNRDPEPAETPRQLDVVICTYDNPAMLDVVLDALAQQEEAGPDWAVTVVDNNSPVTTAAVVERHERRGGIPGLRRVVEPRQGLTPARLRGVECTTAPWIAFVDDDCVLDAGWIGRAIEFARAHPMCGGFGGRVIPEYGGNPPAVVRRTYGWAFAEQDLGREPVPVDCLVGAGMVINRSALVASGWPDGPYFADRVGRKLISGGDVEIALRLAATGRPLWYTPECALRHVIPEHRTTTRYLRNMTRGLGVSYSLAQALVTSRSRLGWVRGTVKDLLRSALAWLKTARHAFAGSDAMLDARLSGSYELGRWIGATRVATLLIGNRCEFFGRARTVTPFPEADHVVRPD